MKLTGKSIRVVEVKITGTVHSAFIDFCHAHASRSAKFQLSSDCFRAFPLEPRFFGWVSPTWKDPLPQTPNVLFQFSRRNIQSRAGNNLQRPFPNARTCITSAGALSRTLHSSTTTWYAPRVCDRTRKHHAKVKNEKKNSVLLGNPKKIKLNHRVS